MFKIKIYDLDNSYIHMSDMMENNEPVFEYEFKQPNTEEEFDEIIKNTKHFNNTYCKKDLFGNDRVIVTKVN